VRKKILFAISVYEFVELLATLNSFERQLKTSYFSIVFNAHADIVTPLSLF